MSWNDYRRRGHTLLAVIDHADRARDGALPMDLPGVRENFTDELDLVAALVLRWHARLSGNLERALTAQPMSPEDAVADAWADTARQLPGVRAIIDRAQAEPSGPAMAGALAQARRREWADLALAAGQASSPDDPRAVVVGERIEDRARERTGATPVEEEPRADVEPRPDFVQRLRAALVA